MANPPQQDTEFKRFAAKRIIIGIILIVAVLWTLGGIMGIFERPEPIPQAVLGGTSREATADSSDDHAQPVLAQKATTHAAVTAKESHAEPKQANHTQTHTAAGAKSHDDSATTNHKAANASVTQGDSHGSPAKSAPAKAAKKTTSGAAHGNGAGDHDAQTATDSHADAADHKATGKAGHEAAVSEAISPKLPEHKQKGVATVEAIIGPMEHELEERFWGWRPNDLINITDNVNYYQLGVLEVTRRAVVALNERISRTGTTDAFDPDLENATNWFMIKATKYWFPSAESKYHEGIVDLKKYGESLQAKRATFYTRPDNLIPLLASFEDLLGSCDENLVKHFEEDGSEVSWLKADNYYFYAQGVAAAMAPILEAIHHDFLITLETRHGIELLHHAVESCKTAAGLDPWLITDSSLDGILANHRANMAAPISHARFYLGVLIKALST